jgi:hypothetical protein
VSRARTWWPIVCCLVAAVALLYAVVLPGGYLTWLWVAMVLWLVAAVGRRRLVCLQRPAFRLIGLGFPPVRGRSHQRGLTGPRRVAVDRISTMPVARAQSSTL